ncbi:MAG: polysaccharide deacetylase family protein [Solirubrobacteraceae bacterium]
MSSPSSAGFRGETAIGAPAGALMLTFDDGPDEQWTARVLYQLQRCRASATFFMVGERVLARPQLAHMVLAAGHELQLHCHRHVRHTQLSGRQLLRDTEQALAALESVGVRPRLWRTPWGICTEASINVAEQLGLRLVGWSIDTHDWRGDPPQRMLDVCRAQLASVGSGVVLMHDALGPGARREGCENTIALLPALLAVAREHNLAPVTVSHYLQHHPVASVDTIGMAL